VSFISYYIANYIFIKRESERQILYIGSIDFIKSLFKFERDLGTISQSIINEECGRKNKLFDESVRMRVPSGKAYHYLCGVFWD